MKALVNNAEFLHDNTLLITFSDGHKQEVDFSAFLEDSETPAYMKAYKAADKFKRFQIESGNVVWGENWDLIFPIEQLYVGKVGLIR